MVSGNEILPPNQHRAAPGKWPVVGERAPRSTEEPWTITVQGLVTTPLTLPLTALEAMPQTERVIDIHCVTRWSKPGAVFSGVPLADLLAHCGPLPAARFVSFVARSERAHSTSLPLEQALSLDTLIALRFDGKPLEEIHGGPVRTVVPNRYFYKSLKWLERIELLSEDRLGYWEAEAGYHNHADPWREERYIAPNAPRHIIERALRERDFSHLDLQGIDALGRDLTGLRAPHALLRDAHFENATLDYADFTDANLSNAHLAGASLRNAFLLRTDCEGADFSGADLRSADLTEASLFGATFVTGAGAAKIDATTQFSASSLEALTIEQRDYLRRFTA